MNKRIINITHRYTRLYSFFGVRTAYSWEELNEICAYLQWVRNDLPIFPTIDEGLGEQEMVNLLGKLYDCEKIVSEEYLEWDGAIDIYENWSQYAIKNEVKYLNKWKRGRAKVEVIEQLLIQARENVLLQEEGSEIVRKLEYIKNGQYVPKEWSLKTDEGDLYTGSLILDLTED